MELVSLRCNRELTPASSYGLGWYKYAIATQWYQFHTTHSWWSPLNIYINIQSESITWPLTFWEQIPVISSHGFNLVLPEYSSLRRLRSLQDTITERIITPFPDITDFDVLTFVETIPIYTEWYIHETTRLNMHVMYSGIYARDTNYYVIWIFKLSLRIKTCVHIKMFLAYWQFTVGDRSVRTLICQQCDTAIVSTPAQWERCGFLLYWHERPIWRNGMVFWKMITKCVGTMNIVHDIFA